MRRYSYAPGPILRGVSCLSSARMVLLDPVSLLDGVVGTSMGLGVRAEMVGGKVLQRWASRCEEGGVSRWEVEVEGGSKPRVRLSRGLLLIIL